jgi:hypothetical protein
MELSIGLSGNFNASTAREYFGSLAKKIETQELTEINFT